MTMSIFHQKMAMLRRFLSIKRLIILATCVYVLRIVTGVAFVRQEGDHDCKLITINNIQRNICTERQNEQTINTYNTIPVRTPPSPQTLQKLVCNITFSPEMDLMKMKKLPFIKRFKNPCWYEEKEVRCLPYMHMVGTAKCGSTDLFERIARHPDFVKPTRKEPSWLSSGRFYREESFSFYTKTFFSPISGRLSKITGSSNLITGDASVYDLHGGLYWRFLGKNVGHEEPVENNAEYIHHLNSKAKILINVRNPIDRLWSEYLALSKAGNISAENFHELILTSIGLYKGCLKTRSLRSCMYDEPLARYTCLTEHERKRFERVRNCRFEGYQIAMLYRGVYHVFIKDYVKVFSPDQLLVQRIEDISNRTTEHLLRTFEFLGLEKPPEHLLTGMSHPGRHNPRRPANVKKGDMLASTRRVLYDFYRPHNEQLANLMGDSKYNYGQRN